MEDLCPDVILQERGKTQGLQASGRKTEGFELLVGLVRHWYSHIPLHGHPDDSTQQSDYQKDLYAE